MAPIIDAWIQHPTSEFLSHEMFVSVRRWIRMDDIPAEIPLSSTIEALDRAGVSRAMISAWWGPQGPLLRNEQIAAWILEYPDRLAGIASVDLMRPREAVCELRRCVCELGFKGLRILPRLWRLPPNDRRYYPLYSECTELDVPFCPQVGHAGPMCPSEPGRPIPYLDDVAHDFPDLKIVGGHIGYPWTAEMISLATKHPNVFIDTSAYRPKRYPSELKEFMSSHGRTKVLFASNFPMIDPKACMDELESLQLDDEARAPFLHGNASRVFALDDPKPA